MKEPLTTFLDPSLDPSLKPLVPKKKQKTYNNWDSLVVTHPTTNQSIYGLCMAERTGCPTSRSLWSYVLLEFHTVVYTVADLAGR